MSDMTSQNPNNALIYSTSTSQIIISNVVSYPIIVSV
jgi:hypothetical protein